MKGIESETGIWPLYAACDVVAGVRGIARAELPDKLADELAARAERVWRHNPAFRRALNGRYGREVIRSYMRHWLAATLRRTRPEVFRALPDRYALGRPAKS